MGVERKKENVHHCVNVTNVQTVIYIPDEQPEDDGSESIADDLTFVWRDNYR